MPRIGLSTLYLSLPQQPFEKVLQDLTSNREGEETPEIWEMVDVGEHTLTKERVKLLRGLWGQGYRFTVHSPFLDINVAHIEPERRRETLSRLRTSIDAASEIEAEGWVLHPGLKPADQAELTLAKRLNEDSVVNLYDYARAAGIKPALENMAFNMPLFMTTPQEFEELFKGTGIGMMMTFDAGHAHIGGLVKDFVARLSERFLIVHSHDNKGGYDEHLKIGDGTVEWRYVTTELARRGFEGLYIVESTKGPFESVAALRRLLPKPLA